MTVREAYRILELQQGSSLEEVKQSHRRLIKIWHPDRFSDESDKNLAHHKTIDINQASTLLKRVKHVAKYSTATNSNRTTSSTTTKSRSKDPVSSKVKQKAKSPRKRQFVKFEGLSRLDIFLGRITTRNHLFFLKHRSPKLRFRAIRNTKKVDSYFQKKLTAFKQLYAIGFYKSKLNKFAFSPDNESNTSLSSYSLKSKYEAIVNYEQVKDTIFYSVNKSWNVGLKYILGTIIIGLMIRIILFNFYQGVAVYGWDVFLMQEFIMVLAFLALFLPDHIFQRLLLARFHNQPAERVKRLFSNGKKIPAPWSRYFHSFMLAKFGFVFWLLI